MFDATTDVFDYRVNRHSRFQPTAAVIGYRTKHIVQVQQEHNIIWMSHSNTSIMAVLDTEPLDIIKTLNLAQYIQQCISQNQRDDQRVLNPHNINQSCRKMTINNKSNTLTHTYGQSHVTLGNTAILCGITLEVGKLSELVHGSIDARINIELVCTPACNNQKYTINKIDNNIVSINQQLNAIIRSSRCVDNNILNIINNTISNNATNLDQYCYVLYVDLICINDDGNLFDAALLACITALQNTYLPQYTNIDSDTNELTISEQRSTIPLQLNNIPIATTFAILGDSTILIDPTYDEECVSTGLLTVCVTDENNICYINKIGIVDIDQLQMEHCIQQATQRHKQITMMNKQL